jgi:hypothetical protein
MASGSAVLVSSSSLLIRWHYRARCQAEIPLIALSEIVEPLLPDLLAAIGEIELDLLAQLALEPDAGLFPRLRPVTARASYNAHERDFMEGVWIRKWGRARVVLREVSDPLSPLSARDRVSSKHAR